MPAVTPKITAAQTWPQRLSAAAGQSSQDFWVLGYNPEYDNAYGPTNPATYQSPTSRFTHVLHFSGDQRDAVHRLPDRLLDIIAPPTGPALAAGFPRSVFDVAAAGIVDNPFKRHGGVFTALWARTEQYVLAVGMEPGFLLARTQGTWQALALPEGTTSILEDIYGFHEQDVYIVGWEGTILWFDGARPRRIPTPATSNFYAVAPLGDKHVCIAGQNGLLLFGNRNGLRVVPTATTSTIYALAAFGGRVVFPSPEGVWAFDGKSAPALLLDMPADWVSGLGDAIVISHETDAWLYDGTDLVPLDTAV